MPPSFLPVLVTDAWRAGPLTVWHAVRQILATDMLDRLEHVRTPALVIWGEHDTMISPAAGRQLCDALPNARWVLVPGAGHNPMWDRPDVFNAAVLAFLTAQEPAHDS
jgi:pimeloyl-ACP methyl ester carboxylesterase